jgi:hypothetical protein
MPEETQDDLINRARQIVDQYADPVAQDELFDEMQRKGIIDAHGQVVFPLNGQHHEATSNDHPAKG